MVDIEDINKLAKDTVFQAWRYYYHYDNTWDDHKWDTNMKFLIQNRNLITDTTVSWIFNHPDVGGCISLFWVKENEFSRIFNEHK